MSQSELALYTSRSINELLSVSRLSVTSLELCLISP